MILSYDYGRRLIRQGKAECVGHTNQWEPGGLPPMQTYAILNRLDLERTDHVMDNTKSFKVVEHNDV